MLCTARKYILLISALWPIFLIGQQSVFQQKIVGYVLADDTGLPLAFAHVSVGGNEVGTLCNAQGLFVLKIPQRLMKDSLQFRYLGYIPRMLAVENIGKDTLRITLKNQNMTLEPIEILSISPEDTLRKAWRLRSLNYETRPSLLRGFYREEMEDENADIQFLFAEGVLELYKSSYRKQFGSRVRVLKGRQKKLPNGYSRGGKEYLLPQITQGPHLGLLLDVMKTDDSFVKRQNHKLYNYSFKEVIYLNNRLSYVFSFVPKDPAQLYAICQGKIYLDLESLAIVRATYEFTEPAIRLYNRNTKEIQLHTRSFEINYMEYQDKWYLQDARVNNRYYFPPVDAILYSSHTFLTTEIINDEIKDFPMYKSLSLNDAFVEAVDILEEKFWEEYNVVPVEKR